MFICAAPGAALSPLGGGWITGYASAAVRPVVAGRARLGDWPGEPEPSGSGGEEVAGEAGGAAADALLSPLLLANPGTLGAGLGCVEAGLGDPDDRPA